MRVEQPIASGSAALGAGLLVADQEAARAAKGQERRVEEWIVSNLERKPLKSESLWESVLGKRVGRMDPTRKEKLQAAKDGDWGRFRLVDRQGTAVLRLSDAMLLKEQVIQEFSDDLIELIDAGYERVVLNFQDVERLSVQIAVGLVEAHLQCASRHGGRLRACGVRPDLAEAFALTGLDGEIEVHPDEAAALEAPWPELDEYRPLPVNILSALRILNENDERGGSPPMTTDPAAKRISARLEMPSGRTLTLGDRALTIGRDSGCKIKVNSASVSRNHASIEKRDGRVVLRDLRSTNGTRVNGRKIADETELRHGDTVEIGPLRFTLRLDDAPARSGVPAAESREWSPEDVLFSAETIAGDRDLTVDEMPVPMPLMPEHQRMLAAEIIQGTLVLTPLHSRLDDESRIGPLRVELQSLGERNLPPRVVVDLRHVTHVSSGAIGVLVAHALKLEREGGEMRLSQVAPRVMTVLNQIRLPMLIEIHPTTDEAVLVVWRNAGREAAG